MTLKKGRTQRRPLASLALKEAFDDFILSRQAMQCAPATLEFYNNSARVFLVWSEQRGVTSPIEVTARTVREYLAELAGSGKADTTVHDQARAIKTLLRFWHAEKYLSEAVTFPMPRLAKKRLPVLTAAELTIILSACSNTRDKALILLMADSGLRRAEVCALNWGDIDFQSGLIKVLRGKGGKARSAVIGFTARRAVLAYSRTVPSRLEGSPLFLARSGRRLAGDALRLMFRRLSLETGVHVSPHALRRTFVILSLRAGMDVLHLQAMLGHASLDMVAHYAQMVDDDLLEAHREHSPIDNLARLK